MRHPDDAHLDEPRQLSIDERRLLDQLLQHDFAGRGELQTQLADARIVAHGPPDTRTVVFAPPGTNKPRVDTGSRIPVDAVMTDLDGTNIEILLHVVDGYAYELEIYRVDGAPIERELLDGPVKLVNWLQPPGVD